MRSKFSKFALASSAIAALALATIPAVAETTTLKVPFNFTVNGKECPAGLYSVQRELAGNIVRLQNKDASRTFSWIAGTDTAANGARVVLRFDEQGDAHALRSVQYGPMVTSRLDKKNGKSVEIALPGTPGD